MTNADPLPPTVLSRKAVVYVRQSTQTQVQVHLESQRRQYDLVDEARRHGFHNVDVIDTATFTVDDELTPLGIRGDRPLDSRPGAVLRNGLLIHPTVMGRAEWFRSNPYDPVYVRAEDRELWSRTCATANFARLCEPLFFYREGLTGNLRNYLRSERTVRDILRRYGPPLVGGRQTRVLVMRSRLKSMADLIGTKVGLQGRLIRKRNRPLNAAEIREGRRILSAIRNTPVAGLVRVSPMGCGQTRRCRLA